MYKVAFSEILDRIVSTIESLWKNQIIQATAIILIVLLMIVAALFIISSFINKKNIESDVYRDITENALKYCKEKGFNRYMFNQDMSKANSKSRTDLTFTCYNAENATEKNLSKYESK